VSGEARDEPVEHAGVEREGVHEDDDGTVPTVIDVQHA
jgi:hypothetical protein